MGDSNILSNGTCYWAQGQKMDPGFIPCGNDLYGHKHCCWAGDYCLVDNACFGTHGGTGDGTALTYLAGCSDPEYADPSCPNKNPYQGEADVTTGQGFRARAQDPITARKYYINPMMCVQISRGQALSTAMTPTYGWHARRAAVPQHLRVATPVPALMPTRPRRPLRIAQC